MRGTVSGNETEEVGSRQAKKPGLLGYSGFYPKCYGKPSSWF